jgi:soluble lytic murein transglycosylase-like protein
MNRYGLLLYCLIVLFSAVYVGGAKADDPIASNYLHMRNALGTAPCSITDLAADQNNPASGSKYYEFSGRVVGQVSSDNQPVVLIQADTVSAEVQASQTFLTSTDWMTSGNVIRVLAKSVPNTADGSSAALVLIAAGPEYSVSTLEKKLAADEAKIAASAIARRLTRRTIETSRSASYSLRNFQNVEPVSGLSDRAAAIYPTYYRRIAQLNPRLTDDALAKITKSILYYADAYQLDPRLIIAMVTAESDFDPNSVSRTGAVGLGQLMPETAMEHGVTNPYDPEQNIAAAVQILSTHVQKYGGAAPCGVVPINTLLLTMAAYNAGEGAVRKYGGVPPYRETQNYVRKVNEIYRRLCGG